MIRDGLVDADRRVAVVAAPRVSIHAMSSQTWRDGAATSEAVAGGCSARAGVRVGLERQQRALGAEDLVFVDMVRLRRRG